MDWERGLGGEGGGEGEEEGGDLERKFGGFGEVARRRWG